MVKKKINWKEIEKEFRKQDEILEKWVKRNYGKRCKEYCRGCILCEKWKIADKLKLSDSSARKLYGSSKRKTTDEELHKAGEKVFEDIEKEFKSGKEKI